MGIPGILFSGSRPASAAANLGLLLLRLYAGLALALAHGWGKLPPSEKFVEGVKDLGFPAPAISAWMAGLSEFGGGILLALGLMTRPAALAVGFTMGVAGFLRHAQDPFRVKELAFAYLAVAVLYLFAGAGSFSIDAMIRARRA